MSSFAIPISSSIGGIDFGVMSDEEIQAVSVKRIYNTPSLDSFNNPVPGGLYDAALGAWGIIYVQRVAKIPGLAPDMLATSSYPFIYTIMARAQINNYACKLRLLQYGLIEEAHIAGNMELRKGARNNADSSDDDSDDEDDVDLIQRRNAYVKRCIANLPAQKRSRSHLDIVKDPTAAEMRRNLVRDFLKEASAAKKCTSCSGISPPYRRDKYSKIFRKPLPQKARIAMMEAGFQIPNPLILMEEANRLSQRGKEAKKPAKPTGPLDGDDGNSAEQQISMGNAVLMDVEETDVSQQVDGGESQQYVPSSEVYASFHFLFDKEQEILDLIYDSRPFVKKRSHVSPNMFFIKNILVPPNKFRPAAQQGPNEIMEAQQNTSFGRVIKLCDQINQISRERQGDTTGTSRRIRDYRDLLQSIVQLQDAVNSLIDRDRNPSQGLGAPNEDGIKQRLEKKDGLFRKNMMGKRVNFAARSVISPDPNIETNEIGIPLVFAKKLTYPEPVTNHNYWELKQAVINGPDVYPGAAAVENELGQVVSLKFKSVDERVAIANLLLSPSNMKLKRSRNKRVYRHLTTGDVVLMNRQPTLHKPSIMGHRARVLTGERTIRMHYANCNTYNADFDGDEMNMHFPQNEIARAEAMQLADTDHQYLVATSGKPLRGLIQDHLSMGVWLTCRDSFFDESDYHQLLYSCLRPENSHTVSDKIWLMPPTIFKPQPLWTGKQIISTVLKNITPENRAGLNLDSKSSTPGDRWGDEAEAAVTFIDGEMISGILDKNQLGPSVGGLVHSIHEVYGHIVAGKLIGILGRLLTKVLHMRAFTCGMDDLRLTEEGNANRKKLIQQADGLGKEISLKYVTLDENKAENEDSELQRRLEEVLRDDDKHAGLDGMYKSRAGELSSEITKACLPSGLEKAFPFNNMQAMTVSGAKGSMVNANLISCNLGQQVLEGRRVPVMISGKTLPSFQPYETKIGAGGYVFGRFLTGIKPHEYYFHAMAGREGLIDTAVKTSRSGYLQRCLIKGMEGLKAEYDTSVRDTSDGSLVQFLYGEDGLDITKQKHLDNFTFLAQNYMSMVSQVNGVNDTSKVHSEEASNWNKAAMKKVKKSGKFDAKDPALAHFPPGANYGSTSERFASALKKYLKTNPDNLLKEKSKGEGEITKKAFTTIMNMKYMKSVIDPGEAIGIVAGQSVGEPSTQMTLNTFHLAGHAAKNVTLGIPRLREIVMTASNHIMTPTMTLKLNKETDKKTADLFAKTITKLTLAEVIDKLRVRERVSSGQGLAKAKIYDIQVDFFPSEAYCEEYAIQISDVLRTLEEKFVPRLIKLTDLELKKRTAEKSLSSPSAAQPEIGASVGVVEEARRGDRDGGDDDDNDDEDLDDAKRASSRNSAGQASYEAPDEGEQEIMRRQDSPEPDSDDESTEKKRNVSAADDSDSDTDMENSGESKAKKRANDRDRVDALKGKFPALTQFKFDSEEGNSCTIQLQYDISTPKLLLLPLVENAARTSVIQFIPGLGSCAYIPADRNEPAHVITEGVNLIAMRDYQDIIDPHSIYSNSVSHMLGLYGVEAARATIVSEVGAVFEGHGIKVDNRHLTLIADVMTQAGGYRPFNRMGIVKDSTSPLMKMSFETTVRFLRDAVLERDWDNLNGPSSRIVVGRVGTVGTGAFDVLAPVG
ncbi:hypothetical protein FQN49_003107 [Arthroderma sp. PD_2]|nr:hypothetical protein FQN49_003107 [Arthroderma sp. PD_2]